MVGTRIDAEGVWRESWLLAPDGASTFYETLQSQWQAARALNAGGSLSNISRNSSSHGFAAPSSSHRTTVDQERTHLCALRYYESLQTAMGITERTEANELLIYNEGLARQFIDINPSPEYFTDFSSLRA